MRVETREALPGWIALLVAAAVAWRKALADSAAMGDAPGTMGMSFVPFVAMWVPMMAAMMLPAIAPVATLWAGSIVRGRRPLERLLRLGAFACGYLLVWTAAGAIAFALARPIEIGLRAGLYTAHAAAAVVFAIAGIYQLSPLREACLAKCRSPLTVLGVVTSGKGLTRDARAGTLHGAWCLACCWSLMAVLALVGLMNVPAMIALAILVFIEKTTRFGVPAGRLAGALMIAAAVGTILVDATR